MDWGNKSWFPIYGNTSEIFITSSPSYNETSYVEWGTDSHSSFVWSWEDAIVIYYVNID